MPVVFNILHWFSAVMLIGLSFYCLRKASTKNGYNLCVFFLVLSGWCLSSALAFTVPDIQTKIELARLKFLFIPFLSVNVFFIARCFADNEKLSFPAWVGLLGIPVITAIIALSPWHELLINNYKIETIMGFPILTFGNGPWFVVHIIYSRIIFIWSLVILVQSGFNNQLVKRKASIVFLSILVPFAIDSIAVVLYPVMRYIQLVPVALTISSVCFYYVIFKEKLLELVPIARNMVIDSIPDIYLVIDYKNRLVDFNLHAQNVLNLNRSSCGKPISDLPSDNKGLLSHLNDTIWNEQSNSEYEIPGQSQYREYYSIKLEKIISKTSEFMGRVIIIKNISEQKKYEAQLTQTVEIRTKFIGIMAHDLIGNISGHTLFLESLLDHHIVENDPDLKASLDFLLHSSQNVTKFVEGLLSWSRENINGFQMKKSTVDLNHLVSDSIHFLEAISIQKDIEFNVNIPSKTIADVDPDMIQTVLRNIIGNAIKISPLNGKVHIYSENRIHEIEIFISDEGPGVNEDELNKFLHGLSLESYKGGLGLTLSRDFIHMHKGKFTVKNKQPAGAVFSFTLPVSNS